MKQSNKKFILGITGRTATGKSTFAEGFAGHGFYLIDADSIYHDLLENCDEMKDRILKDLGTLDRKKILEQISSDNKSLKKLNEITHSFVADEIKKQIENNSGKFYVLDVPVPVETGFLDICDYIVTTDCSKGTQIDRLMERNGYSSDEAEKRINLQMDRTSYNKIADCIVHTEDMEPNQINETVKAIIKRIGKLVS
jgi:dephospho-CoA kinase